PVADRHAGDADIAHPIEREIDVAQRLDAAQRTARGEHEKRAGEACRDARCHGRRAPSRAPATVQPRWRRPHGKRGIARPPPLCYVDGMRARGAIALAAGVALSGCVSGLGRYPGYSGPYRSYSPPYYRDYDAPYYSSYYGPKWGRDGLSPGE